MTDSEALLTDSEALMTHSFVSAPLDHVVASWLVTIPFLLSRLSRFVTLIPASLRDAWGHIYMAWHSGWQARGET